MPYINGKLMLLPEKTIKEAQVAVKERRKKRKCLMDLGYTIEEVRTLVKNPA